MWGDPGMIETLLQEKSKGWGDLALALAMGGLRKRTGICPLLGFHIAPSL